MTKDGQDKQGRNPRTTLAEAVREIKIATAERSDVVVDMKEADRARLEILAQELQPIFDDVPLDDERFDFAISSGLQPRLWIDATAQVIMGKDRRKYCFVRDTRMGRVTIEESNQTTPVAKAVTKYIAERLYERELEQAGEEMQLRPHRTRREVTEPVVRSNFDDESEVEAMARSFRSRFEDLTSRRSPREITKPGLLGRQLQPPMAAKDRRSKVETSPIVWLIMGLFLGAGALLLWFRQAIFASIG